MHDTAVEGFIDEVGIGLSGDAGAPSSKHETAALRRTGEGEVKTSLEQRSKKEYKKFLSDRPGKRFLNLYLRSRRLPVGIRVGLGAMGLVLSVGGLALGFIPGVPGIFLGAAGLALVAAQFRFLARICDKSEIFARTVWEDLQASFAHFRKMIHPRKHRPRKKTVRRSSPKAGHGSSAHAG